MHLVIDIREACNLQKAGKGYWLEHCLRELCTRNITMTLLTDRPVPDTWNLPTNTNVTEFPSGILWHWKAAHFVNTHYQKHQVYLSPTSVIVPCLLQKSIPCIPVIHDLIAFRNEPHNRKAKYIERLLLRRCLSRAFHTFTISESTKQDVLQKFPTLQPNTITTVYAGSTSHSGTWKPNTAHPYILCISTLCPRKNQKRLIEAFANLPEHIRTAYRLILVGGRGWDDQAIIDEASKTDNVEWKGYISTAECQKLLEECTVFALPSLYEGFGLPVLDALSMGIPVFTSNRGSLAEVSGEAALHTDPEHPEVMTEDLALLLSDTLLQQDLSTKGPLQAATFSWKQTVDHMMSTIEERLETRD